MVCTSARPIDCNRRTVVTLREGTAGCAPKTKEGRRLLPRSVPSFSSSVERPSYELRTSCARERSRTPSSRGPMWRWRMKTAVALLLVFYTGSAAAEAPGRLVELHGNVLFDELVYRSVLDLPESSRATPADALGVSAKLLGFLRRAGYDLATVRAKVQGEQIAVDIDEGRLDKIIVFGEGIMETFRFKLELAMPSGVFNRPALEGQLRVLADRYRLRHYSYDLVPVEVQENPGQSIDELDLAGIRPGLRYELHILIATSPWSRGFSPEVSIGSPEGLGAGGQYREQDFWVPDDRWELRARVAGAVRQHLDADSSQ